jgi:hypothetical protein
MMKRRSQGHETPNKKEQDSQISQEDSVSSAESGKKQKLAKDGEILITVVFGLFLNRRFYERRDLRRYFPLTRETADLNDFRLRYDNIETMADFKSDKMCYYMLWDLYRERTAEESPAWKEGKIPKLHLTALDTEASFRVALDQVCSSGAPERLVIYATFKEPFDARGSSDRSDMIHSRNSLVGSHQTLFSRIFNLIHPNKGALEEAQIIENHLLNILKVYTIKKDEMDKHIECVEATSEPGKLEELFLANYGLEFRFVLPTGESESFTKIRIQNENGYLHVKNSNPEIMRRLRDTIQDWQASEQVNVFLKYAKSIRNVPEITNTSSSLQSPPKEQQNPSTSQSPGEVPSRVAREILPQFEN